ncbi:MAG: alkyl hydroperoxide reductase [Tepidisphaerales bacterium]
MRQADDHSLRTPDTPSAGIGPREMRIYRASFLLAAIYNVLWGTAVILFPTLPFRLAGLPLPDPVGLLLWQCIGMFVLVYAVGYAYLWHDPLRYAPFALVATLGKIFGPIGWLWAYTQGIVPLHTGLTILTNDVLWWPVWFPFVYKTLLRPLFRPAPA